MKPAALPTRTLMRRVLVPCLLINAAVLWLFRDQLAGLADIRLHAPDLALVLILQLHFHSFSLLHQV